MEVTQVGKRIKARRKELKMSAEELGKRIGKDRSTVYRYENGEIDKLPFEILSPLAVALDTTIEYLVDWENVANENTDATEITIRLGKDKNFARVVTRALNDNDFLELCNILCNLEPKKVAGVKAMLDNFTE